MRPYGDAYKNMKCRIVNEDSFSLHLKFLNEESRESKTIFTPKYLIKYNETQNIQTIKIPKWFLFKNSVLPLHPNFKPKAFE